MNVLATPLIAAPLTVAVGSAPAAGAAPLDALVSLPCASTVKLA